MKFTKEYIEAQLKRVQKEYEARVKKHGAYYSDRKDGKHWLVAAYRPTKGVFRISKNCDLFIDNQGNLDGRSYKWWSTLKTVKGKIIFNKYRYSNTTSKHQNDLRSALRYLNIPIDHEFECSEGFQVNSFENTVKNYLYAIGELKAAIKDKNTNAVKNQERKKEITELQKELTLFMSLFDVPKRYLSHKKEMEKSALNGYISDKERKAKKRQERKAYLESLIPAKKKTPLGKVIYDA